MANSLVSVRAMVEGAKETKEDDLVGRGEKEKKRA